MKQLASFCMILLLIGSCNKSAEKKTNIESSLTGTWLYKGEYYSIGGPAEWRPAASATQTMSFFEDGAFSAPGIYSGASHYSLIDTNKLQIEPMPTDKSYQRFIFELDDTGNQLTLSPIEPSCIEGCSAVFERISHYIEY